MGACTVPTRLTDADRHGLSLRGAERAAALHPPSSPPPLSSPAVLYRNTILPIEQFRACSNLPLLSPPPRRTFQAGSCNHHHHHHHRHDRATPRRPRRNYKHSFHTKSRCWRVVPKRAPREPHFRYGLPYARPSPSSTLFQIRAITTGGGRRVDSSSDSGLGLVSSSRIFPREAKISMTLPPHLVHG